MKDISIRIYSKENINQYSWADSSSYEKKYIIPFIKDGARHYIDNVDTKVSMLCFKDYVLPITINNEEYKSSYVCSPYNALITYSKEEIVKIKIKPLVYLLEKFIGAFDRILKKAKVNKVICINNWLLSTNLYSAWDGSEIKEITEFLKTKFPDHIILFRSLNDHCNSKLMSSFRKNNYYFVPSRQVYILDRSYFDYTKKRDTKKDLRTLYSTDYQIIDHDNITDLDYERIVWLYNKLYLEKYSYNNPQFNVNCIKLWHTEKLLIMFGIRNQDGILEGIIGCFERNGIITTPLVGYNTNLPQSNALYRLLTSCITKYAINNQKIFNMSSGVSSFKILRGAFPKIEYSAIYIDHLPILRRFVWQMVRISLQIVAVPLLKIFKL